MWARSSGVKVSVLIISRWQVAHVALILLFSGAEGLLWRSHIRAAFKPRALHPHQLDGPRRKRLLFFLQRLTTTPTWCKNPPKKQPQIRWVKEDVAWKRRAWVPHSSFITNLSFILTFTLQRPLAVLFIKKWDHSVFLLLICSDVATITHTATRWPHLDTRPTFISRVGPSVNTGLRWSVALICKRLNKDLNPFIISFDGPCTVWAVNKTKVCLCVALN